MRSALKRGTALQRITCYGMLMTLVSVQCRRGGSEAAPHLWSFMKQLTSLQPKNVGNKIGDKIHALGCAALHALLGCPSCCNAGPSCCNAVHCVPLWSSVVRCWVTQVITVQWWSCVPQHGHTWHSVVHWVPTVAERGPACLRTLSAGTMKQSRACLCSPAGVTCGPE